MKALALSLCLVLIALNGFAAEERTSGKAAEAAVSLEATAATSGNCGDDRIQCSAGGDTWCCTKDPSVCCKNDNKGCCRRGDSGCCR